MARPKIVWTDKEYKQFEALCAIQATGEEITYVMDIDRKTIDRLCNDRYGFGYSEAYKKFTSGGKMSLRRYQFELAKRNASMAIWLGKQYLGQRDFPVDAADENLLKNAKEILGELESAIN